MTARPPDSGGQAGSQRRQTSGDARRPRATIVAARWHIRLQPATVRDRRIAPEKRKVDSSINDGLGSARFRKSSACPGAPGGLIDGSEVVAQGQGAGVGVTQNPLGIGHNIHPYFDGLGETIAEFGQTPGCSRSKISVSAASCSLRRRARRSCREVARVTTNDHGRQETPQTSPACTNIVFSNPAIIWKQDGPYRSATSML